MADEIVIRITKQRRGLNFTLDPASHEALEDIESADPTRSNVFIGFDEQEGFETFALDTIENQVVILLTGLSPDRLLEHIDSIEFQRMPSGRTELTMPAGASE